MTRDELTHDEKVSADSTVAAILAALAVAMWNEPCQSGDLVALGALELAKWSDEGERE